ncbi:MAG: M1 family metallopeptidase [Thermoanaerobaculia bacterium]
MKKAILSVVLLFAALSLRAGVGLDDYRSMQKWLFAPAAPLAQGVTISTDTATWDLASGTVSLMQPVSDGAVTGLVFEGEGRFRMTIPDRVEVVQLRRFAGREDLAAIDVPFSKLVLRTSDRTIASKFSRASEPFAPNPVARKRHDTWFEIFGHDVDARVIGGLLTAADDYLRVDVETKDFGWLTFDYDGRRQEEITLQKLQNGFVEQWVSLDRAEDRFQNGRPSPKRHEIFDLEHIAVRADLRKHGAGQYGQMHIPPRIAEFEVEETLRCTSDSGPVAFFSLHPLGKVERVTEDGEEVAFIRDHIGGRSLSIDNRLYDELVTVLLRRPLVRGEVRRITFTYTLEMQHYAGGNSWYPTVDETLLDPHTARLELKARKKDVVRAMGVRKSQDVKDDASVSVWEISRPAKMVTFAVGDRFKEVTIEEKGIPRVVVFGRESGLTTGDMVRNVGVDVANSLRFYQWLFDSPVDSNEIFVTAIASGHGQAFDGFLHLSDGTFNMESPGATELFRAHEVAHQWWGHQVGWSTYRDQWLSEAFSEYAAIMFIESTMKNGGKYVEEILDSYTNMLNGSLAALGSKFTRPWLIEMNKSHRERLGPIDVGYRAGTRDVPGAYVIQTYHKGALVVHMLRMAVRNTTGSDDKFIAILREFIKAHRGGSATTADLQAVVETQLGGNWDWFFDAWVRRAELPTYTWSYETGAANADGTYPLSVRVRRSGVSDHFVVPLPARVELADGRVAIVNLLIQKDDETFTRNLHARPTRVVLNADHAVLAKVKKD